MLEKCRRDETCRVCGADDWTEVISFGSLPLANGFVDPADADEAQDVFPLDVIVCRSCRLMTLRHVVDPEALFKHYVYVSSDSDQIREHMAHIVELATRRAGLASGDLVVELGSNVGTQLAMFQEAGMRVAGVDPAANLAEIANARGVPTDPDFFGPGPAGRIASEQGRAKAVIGRQCFAHIDDVHRILDGVDAVLDDDGVLVIEVPYLLNLLDENQFDTIYHEHLSYFSLHTLRHLFGMHGLRIIDVERVAVHGGSIAVVAARESAARTPEPSVAALLGLEEERGLLTEAPYRAFAERVTHVTEAVRTLVRGLAADGHRVAGYGAPSKGTQLLMACGLTADDITVCGDTTPLKHGKLLPGNRIPVLPPDEVAATEPDYYLLLAWNYTEEVVRKERRFLEAGGKFIVPIPEPRIISAQSAKELV
ncbi:class I SAM-dependent methyltransferase [Streptomyces sp. NPDC059698]|uniref:class I SAM-dependent methyltransferase n=2 Tax=Streptomyces TaxID=1883 RepID=UPI00081CE08B|nr:class I SAM-dependent methyltransferase [Streptomyces sp. CB02366]ANY94431.1 C-methyltransferase [Streptomyces sp. CB02366]OKJ31397.1 SAM-dependent methyltransferase [Streptomyces sp. CB02366]TVP36644.1 SAM-dependent methyltransferase [Streptomyces griseus subsp. griseus]